MKRIGLLSVALGVVLFAASPGSATIMRVFENPPPDDAVSGVSLVSGWAYSTTGNPVSIQLVIDNTPAETIPCCGPRTDVKADHPDAPDNTGFGLLINYNDRLTVGVTHTIAVMISATGEMPVTETRTVTVAKPGGRAGESAVTFGFLNDLITSGANSAVDPDSGDIILAPVMAVDKASGATRPSTVKLSWRVGLQSFVTTSASSDTSFAAVQAIFTSKCAVSGCHVTGGIAPMSLSEGQAFKNLVPIKSIELTNLFRINPGDDDASYLYQKIIANPTIPISGLRMPQGCSGSSCLPDDEIDTIENWINEGAPPPQ